MDAQMYKCTYVLPSEIHPLAKNKFVELYAGTYCQWSSIKWSPEIGLMACKRGDGEWQQISYDEARLVRNYLLGACNALMEMMERMDSTKAKVAK